MDAFNKAENWRTRAAELRRLAATMGEPAAAASLREIAASLDHHALNLEGTMLKFCRLRARHEGKRRPAETRNPALRAG